MACRVEAVARAADLSRIGTRSTRTGNRGMLMMLCATGIFTLTFGSKICPLPRLKCDLGSLAAKPVIKHTASKQKINFSMFFKGNKQETNCSHNFETCFSTFVVLPLIFTQSSVAQPDARRHPVENGCYKACYPIKGHGSKGTFQEFQYEKIKTANERVVSIICNML